MADCWFDRCPSHMFYAAKQYHILPTCSYVVSSSYLKEVCKLIEAEFQNNVEKILHVSKVRCILITPMMTMLQGKLKCGSCTPFVCCTRAN